METMNKKALKGFVALGGDKSPREYITLAKAIENMGYDRLYVYDDLLYHPAWQILSLVAEHTNQIQLGTCLVSSLYSHPIRIARNIAFLHELSNNRSVLGIGKGAFFDLLDLNYSESEKTEACIEAINLIKNLISKDESGFDGSIFKKQKNIKLQASKIKEQIPIIIASFDPEMAFEAGKICDEFQTGGYWDSISLERLYGKIKQGNGMSSKAMPKFSIGGVTCISDNKTQAYDFVRPLLAQYIPYLNTIIKNEGFMLSDKEIEKIKYYVDMNNIKKACSYVSDEVVDQCALVGTPKQVINKLMRLKDKTALYGVSFGPPYGTYESVEENLRFIMEEVITKINS